MSFDIAVWSSRKPVTLREARKVYAKLCEEGDTSVVTPRADSEATIASFLGELTQKYPPISADSYDDENIDDCPWSCDFDESDVHVVMSAVWSRSEEICSFIESLAARHELVCYDPTTDAVRLPPSLGGIVRPLVGLQDVPGATLKAAGARRSSETFALEVEELLDQALCSLRFSKRGKRRYTREIEPETLGTVWWNDLSLGRATEFSVTVFVGIRSQRLERTLSELREEEFHGYFPFTVDVEIGTLMGKMQRLWPFKEGRDSSKSLNQIVAAIQEYALPFMETHATLGALLETAGKPFFRWAELEYRKPVAYYLLGETAKAKEAVEQGLAKLTGPGAPEYQRFAAELFERLGDPNRAAETMKSVPDIGLPRDPSGKAEIRHKDTGEILLRLNTNKSEKVNLQGADLRYADLSGTVLYRTNLRRAKLNHACLDGAQLSETDLREADLSSATLRGATISTHNAERVNLSGADLREATISGNLKRATLVGADLRRARLSVGLIKADLRDADLRDARMVDSTLWEADLTGAKLEGIYLGMERVYPSQYDRKTQWPAGFKPEAHGASRK